MLFNSYVFLFGFLPITYAVFWLLRTARARYVWLAVTGYVFYSYWNPKFCFLMAFSTIVSYLAGLGMLHYESGRARKAMLVVPIVVDLSLLGFFKYANFAVASAAGAARWFGASVEPPHWNIVLPIGISFYTFHTISYIVDSYRRVVKPTRNFFEFAAYVSLFSQLVAGPIVRFRQIESDLEGLGTASRQRWFTRGLSFLAIGLVEKVLVADSFAAFVDPALAHWQTLSTAGAWMAMLGYAFQLLFDFSGYSTMAVGLGYLFGLRIPQNFNSPYKALDPADYWRRWHISLSTCIRDYVYIPLGGSRAGKWLTYRNVMLTMVLCGLWHGAAWMYIAWGAYQGLLLAGYRRYRTRWDALPEGTRQIGNFLLELFGYVIFRSTSFTMAGGMFRAMFVPTAGSLVAQPALAAMLIVAALAYTMRGPNPFEIEHRITWPRAFAYTAATAACLAVIAGTRVSPFIYFQF